jgi:DNA-binding transcriptional LysR family regulator
MEMHQIRYFLSVADEGHISRAAQKCNVSQPSLSRAIKKLEDEFGGALFVRKPGKVELTAFGLELLPLLRNCYHSAQNVKSHAKAKRNGAPQGLRVGFQTGVFHPAFIGVFQSLEDRFSGAAIAISQLTAEALIEKLRIGDIDVGIAVNSQHDDKLTKAPLYQERLEVAFHPGHRFEAFAEVGLAEVAGEKLIAGAFADELSRRFGPANSTGRVIRIDSLCLAQAMTAAGFACSISPEFAPLHPALMRRRLACDHAARQISALTQAGKPPCGMASAFLALCAATRWTEAGPPTGACVTYA